MVLNSSIIALWKLIKIHLLSFSEISAVLLDGFFIELNIEEYFLEYQPIGITVWWLPPRI